MGKDVRLVLMMEVLSVRTGKPIADAAATIGDLGIDSRHLADIIFTCEDVYGKDLDFDDIDIDTDTSLAGLHAQILDALERRNSGAG
jgi:acyl carrier protein